MLALCACGGPTAQPPVAQEQEEARPELPIASGPRQHPAAIETVALLESTAKRCETVGQQAIRRLQNENESFHPDDSFEHYLEQTAALDLAIAREAQGVISALVGEVRNNSALEVGRAINDMSIHCDRLCAHVAVGSYTPEHYETGFNEYLRDFENARNRLRREVDISPAELASALLKHQPEIERAAQARVPAAGARGSEPAPRRMSPEEYARQQAEWQAHSERLERERAVSEAAINNWRQERGSQPAPPVEKIGLRPLPAPAAQVVSLEPWHAAFKAKAEPVKAALARYPSLAKSGDPGLQRTCAELVTGAQAALADRAVVLCPEQNVGRRAVAFLQAAKNLADACLAGLSVEATFRHKTAEQALTDLEATLRSYSLAP